MAATRDDVARLAGVSSSTVSYALSRRRTISAETRQRVERAMAELDYVPNAFARGLAGARGGVLALHYPYSQRGVTSSEFEYIAAATEQARIRGYHLLLWSNPIGDVESLANLASEGLVDGVILMELTSQDERVSALTRTRIPFANIGRPDNVDGLWFVDNDYESMGRQAVDHVADLGHEHVLFLSQTVSALERGYGPLVRTSQALELPARRRGIRLDVLHADNSVRGGREAFVQYSASSSRPTAVLAFNELATAGFVQAANLAGTSIPGDVSVVALTVGDLSADMTSPPLTTVSPLSREIALTAVDDLVDQIEHIKTKRPQVLVPPTLTVRGSSGPVPAS